MLAATGTARESDPWPERQRTSARLGRTKTIGPQTPTISWRLQVDLIDYEPDLYTSGIVLDSDGRLFIGLTRSVAAVDSVAKSILWVYEIAGDAVGAPSLFEDRVLFGSVDFFYCLDTTTSEPTWTFQAAPHPSIGSVVDEEGVVYFASQQKRLYARRVSDGSEVWTYVSTDGFNSAGALDGLGRLFIGNVDRQEWLAFHTFDADVLWRIARGHTPGVSPVEEERVYFTPPGSRHLYCVESNAGQEIWNFNCEITVSGGPAVRKDGVIMVNASGGQGNLFAVSPDGEELWRYPLVDEAPNRPPMVDGTNTTYFTTWYLNEVGWVHAVNEDGSRLWLKQMPHNVAPTPILAPDGTLYVLCNDKHLYAFRDPAGDLNFDKVIDLADYTTFDTCMTAPRLWGTRSNTIPGCELLDFDRDWDVDLADFAAFQNQMGTCVPPP